MDLPPYIRRGGDIVLSQPFLQSGTTSYAFVCGAELAKLNALCDAQLNAVTRSSGVVYRPLAPLVALVAADIASIRSKVAPDKDFGWIPERDVAFWIPVVAKKVDAHGVEHDDHFAWFLPYIWVAIAAAMATGREVYGFPKEQGTLAMPLGPSDAAKLSVDAIVIPDYTPSTEAVVKRVVEAERVGGGVVGDVVDAIDGFAGLMKAIFEAIVARAGEGFPLPGWHVIAALLGDALHGTVPMVFLKQFRDVADGSRACFQEVLEADAKLVGFHGAGLLEGEWRVRACEYASHPVVSDLGLAGADVTPWVHAYCKFDFVMENGRSIARRP
jgi:hypothetical protein